MEQRILETIGDKAWMWTKELESYFQVCDIKTRCTTLDPEFTSTITNLVEQGLIKIGGRMEMKGYYKKWGEIVEKQLLRTIIK